MLSIEGIETVEKIKKLASEACAREGCELYDVDFGGTAKHRILRVFVEGEKAPVTIEQCANVSQALSLLLDVEDVVPGGPYELEVSSPGLERQLREPRHYEKSIGKTVRIVLQAPLVGAEKHGVSLQGILKSASAVSIRLQDREEEWEIPYEQIKKARTVYEFNHKQR